VVSSGSGDNSVDIYQINGETNALIWQNGSSNISHECPWVPLSQAIQPGCSVTINFDAAAWAFSDETPESAATIGFYGISNAPCLEIPVLDCQSSEFDICPPPNLAQAICLANPPIMPSFDVQDFPAPELNGIDWEHHSFTWGNQIFSFGAILKMEPLKTMLIFWTI
jgi:hypothetical protein